MPLKLRSQSPTSDRAQLARFRRVATRLAAELGALIREIPAQHRPIARFSRWLDIDRSVCSRFLAAVNPQVEPVDIFAVIPGATGLRDVLRTLGRRGVSRARVSRALVAAAAYEQCIGLADGSQAKLIQRCGLLIQSSRVWPDTTADATSHRHASQAFDAARHLTRTWADACTLTYAVCRHPGGRGLAAAAVQGIVGLRRHSGHLPVVLARNTSFAEGVLSSTTLDTDPDQGAAPTSVLGTLSSDPLPVVTGSRDGRTTVMLVDPTQTKAQPLVIYLGARMTVAAPSASEPHHVVSLIPRVPTRWSLMDVYVHQDLGVASTPDAGLGYVGVEGPILGDPDARWYDRLANPLRPRDLGFGLSTASWSAASRHAEAASILFGTTGWNPQAFRLWRIEVAYPAWGVQQFLRLLTNAHRQESE